MCTVWTISSYLDSWIYVYCVDYIQLSRLLDLCVLCGLYLDIQTPGSMCTVWTISRYLDSWIYVYCVDHIQLSRSLCTVWTISSYLDLCVLCGLYLAIQIYVYCELYLAIQTPIVLFQTKIFILTENIFTYKYLMI